MKKPAPFGKYYLLERINVGGMAEVFRAKAFGVEGFERLVAVKRILPNIAEDKEFIRMFIEEAKLSVQLNHANIAQIFDLGVVDGSYYIALEHVHGRDLRGIFDRCRQVGEPMPVAQACFIAMKLCEGLDYAHNKRDQAGRELHLVHRDVSPQNVLVSFEGEVKIIDFGIAKAAGKGSKTQAGILKGKFGYMSPEQVRGLPVDRRSDVFSCGIVLYELLTGERLFVGESDFSTLEKVRNVEILPPSTYNRRIPDELERIVLKALSKDVDDRYQNAIDLHDELQAFVYTAGEFYSRKDLAGWMKKTFGKEIEDETAKLESYRQLKPPPMNEPPRTVTGSRPPVGAAAASAARRSTQGMAAVGTRPPPPPVRASQQLPVVQQQAKPAPKPRPNDESGELAWDDDELETQIYDNPEDDPKNKQSGVRSSKPLPLQAPASHPAMVAAANPDDPTTTNTPAAPPAPIAAMSAMSSGPDLSSLAPSTSKAWSSPIDATMPAPSSTLNGMGPANGHGSGLNGSASFASGSNKAVAPEPPPMMAAPLLFEPAPRPAYDAPFDPMATFGSSVAKQGGNKRTMLLIAAGGVVVAAAAIVAVILATNGPSKDKVADTQPTEPAKTPGSATQVATAPNVPGADANTGFDLYVTPAGVTQWKLDGEPRTDRLPSRIRGIAPGVHAVQIDPPPGFMSQNQQITVEAGKPGKLEIELQPIQGIHGVFESTPPGATVSLIIDGKRQLLGPSPAKAPLDPRNSYQVLFEKPGYVSVNKPIQFSGQLEEKMLVPLEKAGTLAATTPTNPVTPKLGTTPKTNTTTTPKTNTVAANDPTKTNGGTDPTKSGTPDPKTGVDPKTGTDPKPPGDGAKKGGQGVLMLGSKPSCEIFVDGASTGLHTPQPKLSLPAGKHRITLINNEFGINEKFTVDVKADATEKVIKDFSDRLPK
ncbi:MAG TPA: protein kinase [Kofleriaceae bacterium]|nr:protein kinase [Kofleriaceae bacterium]